MSILNISHTDFIFLHAKDFKKTADFYVNVLGLKQSKDYRQIPGGEFETGNLTLQIIDPKAIGQEFARSQAIAFRVDDVQAAKAKLEAQGIKFNHEIMDSGVCHQAYFEDPSGNPLILHNRYAPEGQQPGDPS